MPTHALAWEPLITKGGGPRSVDRALTFQGAYLALGADAEGHAWVSRSTDGRSWETDPIGVMVKPCPGYDPRPDSTIYAAATNGRQVILVGIEYALDVSPCGTQRAVAWVSSDGRTWQRSQGFGASDGFAEAEDVWPIPSGWEALVEVASYGPPRIWRSVDGLQWQVTDFDAGSGPDISMTIGAAADGTRVLSLVNDEVDSLRVSNDGLHWNALGLTLPIGRAVRASGIVPPGPAGPTWVLITVAEEKAPITWVSLDLREWAHGRFPRDELESIAVTRYGYIAAGDTLCGAGGTCSAARAQYLSIDGLHWSKFTESVDSTVVVDGPAGVLAFSGLDFRVWRLKP